MPKGSISFKGRRVHFGTAFGREVVGLRPTTAGAFTVLFGSFEIATITLAAMAD